MSLPPAAEAALGEVRSATRVVGGSLADAYRVELADGTRAFVKTDANAAPGAFAAEAAGLRWLAEADALTAPEVLDAGDDPGWLALAWVEADDRVDAEALGRGLARLHTAGADGYGVLPPGTPGGDTAPLRVGALEIPGRPEADWATFYAEHRLRPLARLADERGALPEGGRRAVEAVCDRMGELAGPPEPPARLHGDLWSGNVLGGPGGTPVLIDPAAYGGHREIDLAMLRLFGSPGAAFLAAYAEEAPLADGSEERRPLYELLPLLIHAWFFGGGYGSRALAAARRSA